MTQRAFLPVLFCFAAFFIFTGCELWTGCSVLLCLPDFQPETESSAPSVVSWLVEYPVSIENGLPVYTMETMEAETPGGYTEKRIRVARGMNLPILARPVFSANNEPGCMTGGFPAGAVYPEDIDAGAIHLHWEDGFACELLQCCFFSSDIIQGFDTTGFRAGITEKASELETDSGTALPGGCWLIDPGPIICRLGYGLFRLSSIRAADTLKFDIPVSGGEYFSDNHLYPSVCSAGAPPVLSVTVPEGRRTSFIGPHSGEIIIVYFDEKQWCWTNLSSLESASGRR